MLGAARYDLAILRYRHQRATRRFKQGGKMNYSLFRNGACADCGRQVCLFYLVLRGLDTVEDDMTLDGKLKDDLLINFHKRLSQPGWNFDGCKS